MPPQPAQKVAFLPLDDPFPPLSPELAKALKRERELRGSLSNLGAAKAEADADVTRLQDRRRALAGAKNGSTANKLNAEAQGATDSAALKDITAADTQLAIVDGEIAKIARDQAARAELIVALSDEYRILKRYDLESAKRTWMHHSREAYDLTEVRALARKLFVELSALGDNFNFRDHKWWCGIFFSPEIDLRTIMPEIDQRKAELETYLNEVLIDDA